MTFELSQSIDIIRRTPEILEAILSSISKEWSHGRDGEGSWSPYDVLGHLIHGEKTDWIPRMDIILSQGPDKEFEPFDRFAQFRNSNGKSLGDLLAEFRSLRKQNLDRLKGEFLTSDDFQKKGVHPEFGEVTLAQLLSAWVVHDLSHIAQIARVMAQQYRDAVGPWVDYMPILQQSK
ncbi:MAG: DinB family protein [Saprospiraceae bacterium]|nr:DinB family protein [Saprospiraceae bacterium]